SVKRMPSKEVPLETIDSIYYHFKTDIFKREITYSTDKSIPANLVTIDAERAFEVMSMNKRGEKPEKLALDSGDKNNVKKEFVEIVGQDSLTRFDKTKKRKKKGGNSNSKGKAFEDSNLELRQKSKELPKLQSDERKGDANVRRNDRVDEGRRREKPRRNRDRNFGRQGRPKNDNTSSGQNQTNEIQ
ncbi:MAG: hypothetical protein IJZ17_03180, partial [Muribaculaceae bacterium]|nr:hypothetical protein [Muribaculaceae bacterium]